MKTDKIAFVDLETTGLNPHTDEIIEIGVLVYDLKEKTVKEHEVKIRPLYPERMDPKALEVNGYTEKGWKDAVTLDEGLRQLEEICGGATFLAWNATFDWSFLEKAYHDTGLEIPFHYHRICVMSIAWAKVPKEKVQGYSLKTICAYLGIAPEPKVHRALNGAKKAAQVYMRLTNV